MPRLAAAARGLDVYLFLFGMMLLSETARREGLFDWLAVEAVIHARGSPQWLFLLVYGVGTLVTVFMSNDARGRPITPQTARPADRECESVVDCHGDTADVRASGLSPQQYRANASLPDRQVCS